MAGEGQLIFSNTVIIMTSNLGSDLREKAMNKGRVGFGNKINVNENTQAVMEQIFEAARMALPPELWNRIDEPLVFSPLNKDEVNQIAALMLNIIAKDLLIQRDIELAFEEGVIDLLLEAGGYDIQLGARPMRRVISKMIEGPLARIILSNQSNISKIRIGTQADKIIFHQENV
jgi:ATP-dependent Clp protease ATP-binding subunit ClpC